MESQEKNYRYNGGCRNKGDDVGDDVGDVDDDLGDVGGVICGCGS